MREDKISICITTKDRPYLLPLSYKDVATDPRISEIVISDDGESLATLLYRGANAAPISYSRNNSNIGMQANKARVISIAETPWCILLDDDNSIPMSYVDAIYALGSWRPDTIYCPSYAMPHFDYRKFEGLYIDKDNIKQYLIDADFRKCINTCNYFLNKNSYLKSYIYNPAVKAADTIWFAYNWLKDGNGFYIVPGMYYNHAVHEGSGWNKDREENRSMFKTIEKLIWDL